jgi:hypothetical protein
MDRFRSTLAHGSILIARSTRAEKSVLVGPPPPSGNATDARSGFGWRGTFPRRDRPRMWKLMIPLGLSNYERDAPISERKAAVIIWIGTVVFTLVAVLFGR